ncbi:MAG: hypothetical protein KDD50_01635 [Bdellovibrionales bacterium]|nr:hypothetical protein [Bdellovibrionales bacterium]
MKLIIVFYILIGSSLANASSACPYEIYENSTIYCVDLEWMNGEKKLRGQFYEVEQESPYLIPNDEIPQKWVYSRARLAVWKKEDSLRTLVILPDLVVFPYMKMMNGHHHGTGYDFKIDQDSNTYILGQIAFIEMHGIWSLNWKIGDQEGQPLIEPLQFFNLSQAENQSLSDVCISRH